MTLSTIGKAIVHVGQMVDATFVTQAFTKQQLPFTLKIPMQLVLLQKQGITLQNFQIYI